MQFSTYCELNELAYKGNIGVMELVKFHNTAKPDELKKFKELLASGKKAEALELLNKVTGVKLHESVGKAAKLPWVGFPEIGWWQDAKTLRMYHGTNLDHVESFAKEGLNRPDPNTKLYSLAFEPFTARAFAVMGGEAHFLASRSKSLVVPENKRVVIVFDIPLTWINKYKDDFLGGNDPEHKERLLDKSNYDSHSGNDQSYYQLCELRVDTPVPAKYMSGYMLK